MSQLLIRYVLSALIIVVVSETAKRSGWLGGLLASLPLVSVLSMVWLYADTKDLRQVSQLSYGILWYILPSLLLFIVLPFLLKRGMLFYPALGLACGLTMAGYALFFWGVQRLGIRVL